MAATVKIFGERNTGTNVLSAYIEKNSSSVLCGGTFQALSSVTLHQLQHLPAEKREQLIDDFFAQVSPSLQWKHAATNFTEEELEDFQDRLIIITIRNPVS